MSISKKLKDLITGKKTYVINCKLMGAWAECKKDETIQRWDIMQTLTVGTSLILETAYYKGKPFYQVCAPNGMDLGALPSEVSRDLMNNHPQATLTAVLTKVDKEEPTIRLTIAD